MHLPYPLAVTERGHLAVGGVDTLELARRFGTPLYVIDEERVRENCRLYREALADLPAGGTAAYAAKAFWVGGLARIVAEEGLAADVSSEYELRLALAAGLPADRLILHGNNKSREEVRLALEAGVGRIVVDSLWELEMLETQARAWGRRASVLLRLVPDVRAGAHAAIQTGHRHSKFGIPIDDGQAEQAVRRCVESPHLELLGYHAHIGSQILSVEPFEQAAAVMADFAVAMNRRYGASCRELDMGGGLGVRYVASDRPPSIRALVEGMGRVLAQRFAAAGMPPAHLILEPGRSIVGEAGLTLYTVGAIKTLPGGRRLVAVDGGMSDNPRVALYQATYTAVVARQPLGQERLEPVQVVGRLCESGDVILEHAELPPLQSGEVLAVLTTGAYHHSMASNYNGLPRPAVVACSRGRVQLWVRRERYEDLVAADQVVAQRELGSVCRG